MAYNYKYSVDCEHHDGTLSNCIFRVTCTKTDDVSGDVISSTCHDWKTPSSEFATPLDPTETDPHVTAKLDAPHDGKEGSPSLRTIMQQKCDAPAVTFAAVESIRDRAV